MYGAEEVGCVQYFFSLAAGNILLLFCFFPSRLYFSPIGFVLVLQLLFI